MEQLLRQKVKVLDFNLGNGPSKNEWTQSGRLRTNLSYICQVQSVRIQKVKAPSRNPELNRQRPKSEVLNKVSGKF